MMKKNVRRSTLVLAFAIAICADAVEIGLGAIFSEGFISPFDDIMDAVTCAILTLLMGWHFAFMPSFVFKLIPMVDLAPTWTIAVLIASRNRRVVDSNDVSSPDNAKPVMDIEVVKEEPPKL
ncbi:MAG TPA: hypothetical protein VNU95_05330 [Candidatus Acidoferrales bacterium]|jgi:hypothetical protein|nr:hypothetical protein [Candidatus Acidoferrales bacterium]